MAVAIPFCIAFLFRMAGGGGGGGGGGGSCIVFLQNGNGGSLHFCSTFSSIETSVLCSLSHMHAHTHITHTHTHIAKADPLSCVRSGHFI